MSSRNKRPSSSARASFLQQAKEIPEPSSRRRRPSAGGAVSTNRAMLTVARIERLSHEWFMDQECRHLSAKTIELRQLIVRNLLWWVRNCHAGYVQDIKDGVNFKEREERVLIGVSVLRGFYHYLNNEDPAGKWGRSDARYGGKRCAAASSSTAYTYDNHLRTFFQWMVKQEYIRTNPFDKIDQPVHRRSQIEIFTDRDCRALIEAAQNTITRRRDIAVVLLLLDTGIRAAELCALKVRDVDFDNRRMRVLGKGNKERTVSFGKQTARALWRYLLDGRRAGDGRPPDDDEFLIRGIKGRKPGTGMTTSGLLDMIRNLGKMAGIVGVRVSPHTFRHTFATNMVKSGVPAFTLMEMLGHTTLQQTQAYVKLALGDVEVQFKKHSAVDRIVG